MNSKSKAINRIKQFGESKKFKRMIEERDERDKHLPSHLKGKGGTIGTFKNQ